MRIMQVTAHYPPDFVSGGSLAPARAATAMASRGHESYVFAGDLNSLESLQTRDSIEDGIPVRWVGITSFLSWADVKNFDNPEVAAEFGRYLDEISPDVVHVHNLQTLGGGVIDEAVARGIRTIVSMHDFWWVCSRQFLVDQDMHPCSLVVSCGSCQCAVSKEWLEKRTQWLMARLRSVDTVLVPSESMGRALVANGIDSAKVRLAENPVDVPEQAERTKPDRVRFLYAGGPSPLKGFDVVRRAWAMAGVDAELSIYGADGNLAGATFYPPFDPADKDEILASHDVLILPSLAAESHSILTREALASGMAAIVSNTLGPEEAVNDANGAVVTAGSSDELADAIRRFADPEVAWAHMCQGSATHIVTPEDAMRELEQVYLAPRQAATTPAISSIMTNIVFVIGIQGAPARYRAHLPAEALRLRGKKVRVMNYRDPALEQAALAADAVVFYRVPATVQVLDLIDQLRASERIIPVLGDVDDLIFDPDIEPYLDNLSTLTTEERDLWRQGIHRYRTTLEACDMFVGSTATVSKEASRLMGLPAHSYANGVGALLARASEKELARARMEGPLRIGFFSGTKTHDADWSSIEPAVARVLESHPDVELWLGGLVEPSDLLDPYTDRIIRLPLVAWHELPRYLRDIDVNLAPLTDSIFNEAKSAIKWLEAALVHTPTVAFPTQPFSEVAPYLRLARTEDEWVNQISDLLADGDARADLGRRAQRFAMMNLSPGVQGQVYEQILAEAYEHVVRHGHRSGSDFPPVAIDEPPTPLAVDVEPYALPGMIGPDSAAVRAAKKVVRSLKAEGPKATLAKIIAAIR